MRSAVLVFPGINRERDMARALRLVSGRETAMVWHADTRCRRASTWWWCRVASATATICAAERLRRAPRSWMRVRACRRGGLVLGVCKRLPDSLRGRPAAGRAHAQCRAQVICRDVHLKVERSDSPFTRGLQCRPSDPRAGRPWRRQLWSPMGRPSRGSKARQGAVPLCGAGGEPDPAWNVNGATNAIAGIVNDGGNVLGMMPHPENHVEAKLGVTDGRGLFAGLVGSFQTGGLKIKAMDDFDHGARLKHI